MRFTLLGMSLVALLGAGCVAGAVEPLPPPPSVSTTMPPPPPVDYSGVPLPGVPGETTTTVPPIGGGRAQLTGVVVTPEGAVPGAIVRVERLVGDSVGVMQVTTGPDGRWGLPNVLGGRYRIRAFKPAPDNIAALEPEVFFLGGTEHKTVTLAVERFDGLSVLSDVAPEPPVVRRPVALVVQVSRHSVDADGVVRAQPVADVAVDLFGPGRWTLLTTNPVVTDQAGRARWELRCDEAGRQPLSVLLPDGQAFPVDVADCAAPAAPTTSSSSTTTTTTRGSTTTSTTARGGRPTTTTADQD